MLSSSAGSSPPPAALDLPQSTAESDTPRHFQVRTTTPARSGPGTRTVSPFRTQPSAARAGAQRSAATAGETARGRRWSFDMTPIRPGDGGVLSGAVRTDPAGERHQAAGRTGDTHGDNNSGPRSYELRASRHGSPPDATAIEPQEQVWTLPRPTTPHGVAVHVRPAAIA